MKNKKSTKQQNKIIAIFFVIVAFFLIVLHPVRQFLILNEETQEMVESKFVPNDPTWYEMGQETMYIDGYTPMNEMLNEDGEFDMDKYAESFSYSDDGSHKPLKSQQYQKWFTCYHDDSSGFGRGKAQHDVEFSLKLDNPGYNEVGVDYYIEELEFNEFSLYWEDGKIRQIKINPGGLISEVLDGLGVIAKLDEWMEKIDNWLTMNIIGGWPEEAPDWYKNLQDNPNLFFLDLPEWPSTAPSWTDIALDKILDIIFDQAEEIVTSFVMNIIMKVVAKITERILAELGIPIVGEVLLVFQSIFDIGVIWEEGSDRVTSLNNNGSAGKLNEDGYYIFSEDGHIHLRPTTSGDNPSDWKTIYTFNNNYFNEDDAVKNDEPIKLEYHWIEKGDVVKFRIKGINDFKTTIGLGGHYTFMNAIEIDYSEKVVLQDSYYSLSNDLFGSYETQNDYYRETQKNFFDANYNDDFNIDYLPKDKLGNERPFFTNNNSYYDLEKYILENKVIESRDKIQEINEEDLEVIFYDEDGDEINKSNPITSSKINISINSTKNNLEVNGESELLTYEIPYINIEIESLDKNIFDYSEFTDQDFDNASTYNWKYDGIEEEWVINTNEALSFKLNYIDGVREADIAYNDGSSASFEIDSENPTTGSITMPYTQVESNATKNNFVADVHLVDEGSLELEGYQGVNFSFHYNAVPDVNNITILDDSGSVLETEIKTIDLGLNYRNTMPNEIYDSITTDSNVNISSEYLISQYKLIGNEWEFVTSSNEIEINEEGIWAVSTIDDYGNNNFILIEMLDDTSNSILEDWNGSHEYERDKKYYLQQDGATIDLWDSYTSTEFREINLMINSEATGNITETLIKNPIRTDKLSLVTNGFENGATAFDEEQIYDHQSISLKDALENEIEIQMKERGFDSKDYRVVWNNVHDGDNISNDLENLELTIKPKGYWNSVGEVDLSFKLYEYQSISTFEPDTNTLEFITNKFPSGTKFNELTLNSEGKETTIRNELEEELRIELMSFGIGSEYINDVNFEWNVSDDEVVEYDDDISYKIVSEAPMVKGTFVGFITSKTKIDLSTFYIDETALQEVTNQYFNGALFGASYDEYGVNGNVKEDLTTEIKKQLDEQGILEEQTIVEFYDESNNVISDYKVIDDTMKIKYKVTSESSKYFGSIEGEFDVETFDSLDMLYIPVEQLMAITNKFESGTEFEIVKNEMNNYLEGYLLKRGLSTEYIDVVWNLSDNTKLNCKDLLTIEIKSNNFEYIRGEANETFYAIPYFDLSKFVLDEEPIANIILNNTGVVFSDVAPEINAELENQLALQGYDTTLLKITWSIGNEELITGNTTINLKIDGISDVVIHGELSYSFDTELVEKDQSGLSLKFLFILIGLTLLVLIIAISFITFRNKAQRKRDE